MRFQQCSESFKCHFGAELKDPEKHSRWGADAALVKAQIGVADAPAIENKMVQKESKHYKVASAKVAFDTVYSMSF